MVKQFFRSHAPHLPWLLDSRAGVIHHDVIHLRRSALYRPLAAHNENHGVKGRALLQLEVEEQIALARLADIARDKKRVQALQRLRVGKLRERAISLIPTLIDSGLPAKQR